MTNPSPSPVRIAPSILSADFSRLGEEIKAVEEGGADWIHIDVMDGHFVPNITVGPLIVEAVRKVTALPLDVHLMIEEADRFIPEFIKAGAHYLTVHVEACPHLHRTLQLIKQQGGSAGVALNPATPVSLIEPVLGDLDLVLMMSVNPGFGGQSFIEAVSSKVEQLHTLIAARGATIDISVDGGVKATNAQALQKAGATVLVAGSAIFEGQDYTKAIAALRHPDGNALHH